MTTNDTFLRLKRIPYQDMYHIWHCSPIAGQLVNRYANDDEIREEIQELFAKYGWKFMDFVRYEYEHGL